VSTIVDTDATRQGAAAPSLRDILIAEILRDSHRYAAGIEQGRPTLAGVASPLRKPVRTLREHSRDLVERIAGRAGFARRHFDPDHGAARLGRIMALSDGLEATYAALGDERSRRALVDLLKLRVLGPYHAPLRVTPAAYRAKQADADRTLRQEAATFDVSDPWFSPLSLYRVPVDGGDIRLHSHSVDIVSVYLLHQYSYASGPNRVAVEPGDVVLDIGGCWGDTALYFAKLVGPSGKVYTFEFDPENLEVMRANLALNPDLASRIEIVERALWDRSGEVLRFAQFGRMTSVSADADHGSGLETETVTLDDFVEQAGLSTLGFVKMDVEGAELNVLRGARDSLKRFAPRLAVAAYHKEDDLVRLPEAIAAAGHDYRFFLDTFSPVEEETVLFATAGR
jgi:FkbM family methyltransferase